MSEVRKQKFSSDMPLIPRGGTYWEAIEFRSSMLTEHLVCGHYWWCWHNMSDSVSLWYGGSILIRKENTLISQIYGMSDHGISYREN